jgi:LPXTG-motif cell wall-anchored protein
MIRKIVVGGALALGLLAVPAGAQDSPASVLPAVIERPVVVQAAPLPRTGSDIDGELLAGVGLTAAGAALALTARQRRRRFAVQA